MSSFIRFDPLCGGYNALFPNSCCDNTIQDSLVAVAGDVWEVDIPYDEPIALYSCCDDITPISANIASVATSLPSNFLFEFSNYFSDSVFKIGGWCDGVPFCSPTFLRSDYATAALWLNAILNYFIVTLGAGESTRDGNSFYIKNLQTIPIVDDCFCDAIITTNNNFTNVGNACNSTNINDPCNIPLILLEPESVCNANNVYLNIIQLQSYRICIDVKTRYECIIDPKVKLTFPADLAAGCYYLKQEGQGCSQKINVTNGCNSMLFRSRNYGENWTIMRLEFSITNPEFKKEQDISRTTNQVRKIYSRVEKTWSLDTANYNSPTHQDFLVSLESDIFEVEGLWDNSIFSSFKRFIVEETYKLKWDTTFPRMQYAAAQIIIVEQNPIIYNAFC